MNGGPIEDEPTNGDVNGDGPAGAEPLGAEEEWVHAMLSAAPPEPMPSDVAERLDLALAEEVGRRREQNPDEGPAEVTPLRRVRRLLPAVAAAAVILVVAAVVLPQVLTGPTAGDGSSEIASESSGTATGRQEPEAGAPEAQQGARPSGSLREEGSASSGPVALGLDSFRRDVADRVVRRGLAPDPAAPPTAGDIRCTDGRPTSSAGLPVTVGGEPALLFTSGSPETRTFRAFHCSAGHPEQLASTTLDTTTTR